MQARSPCNLTRASLTRNFQKCLLGFDDLDPSGFHNKNHENKIIKKREFGAFVGLIHPHVKFDNI